MFHINHILLILIFYDLSFMEEKMKLYFLKTIILFLFTW